jgi:hypothetical protein
MKEEKKLPQPSVEVLNQFDELCRQSRDPQLSEEQFDGLMNQLNEIITSYDLENYVFTDPATGKQGVKNPAGQVLIPAEYDGFTFVGDHNVFPLSHMAAKKGDKWGVVMADGTNTVLCDFRFDLLIWNPFTALYEACWDGVRNKSGFVNKEGRVFIPNVLTTYSEPWNDFMLLESDGKYGALDVRTFFFVLPEYDDVDWEPDEDVIFHKDGVAGYIIEETGEFVPKDQFEEDDKYADAYVYNTNINI